MLQCLDSYHKSFSDFSDMYNYHKIQTSNSIWATMPVNEIYVAPLDKTSSLFGDLTRFAPGVSEDAVNDTANNLGLAVSLNGQFYPLRDIALKSLADRAKINGSALPKLQKKDLANVLNTCLELHKASALLLIRDEKVSAAHSGDEKDYSVLEITELLDGMVQKLDTRFPKNLFGSGYTDHSRTHATWTLPEQCEELLGNYKKVLESKGKSKFASKIMPGVRFVTSDTGLASAKTTALLFGMAHPINIGGTLAVEHRGQKKVEKFVENLDLLFAKFGDAIAVLEKMVNIYLDYPINAMTAICKNFKIPKKAGMEAIAMFEGSIGSDPVTAHDVFMALQEVMFIMKTEGVPEGKLLETEENLSRALKIRWKDYDLAKAVSW